MLLTPHRVSPMQTESGKYTADWVERMKAANQLVLGLIDNKISASDVARPVLWRKTPNEEYPFVYIGFHSFYADLQEMAIRRRVFIQASDPAKTKGVDAAMNEWGWW